MKIFLKAALTILMVIGVNSVTTLESIAQPPAIQDNGTNGNWHQLKVDVKDNNRILDETYRDFPGQEIFLHGKGWNDDGSRGISDGEKIEYWHADIIHAGYNFSSNGYPNPDYESSDQFYAAHSNTQYPFWDDGFIVWDGKEYASVDLNGSHDNAYWNQDGSPSLTSSDPQNADTNHPNWHWGQSYIYGVSKSKSSGAAIFRADSYIVLSDGFRVIYNPNAKAYDRDERTISSGTNPNSGHVVMTVNNHRFGNGDLVKQSEIIGNDNINGSFKVSDVTTNTYKIKRDGNYVLGDGNNNENLEGGRVRHEEREMGDNAYFHGYVGQDRFDCTNLWNSEEVNDFTQNTWTSNQFEAMDECESCSYADNYDPNNVTLTQSQSGVKLSVSHDANIQTACNSTVSQWLAGGIWSNDPSTVPNTPSSCYQDMSPYTYGSPLESLHYGRVSYEVQLPSGKNVKPALWSFYNAGGPNRHESDEIDVVDADGQWFRSYWNTSIGNSNNFTINEWGNDNTAVDPEFEDEVYHFLSGCFSRLPYDSRYAAGRVFNLNYTQIPGNTTSESFSDNFHIYIYEWIPGEIRFLVDGVELGRTTRHVPRYNVNIIANNQIKSSNNAVSDDMYVRNIKISDFNSADPCDLVAGKRTFFDSPSPNIVSVPIGVEIQSISPNPAQDNISVLVKYLTTNSGEFPVVIELYDLLGNVVKQVYSGIELYSERSYNLSTSGLPNGKYYIRVSSGNKSATKSLVIQR